MKWALETKANLSACLVLALLLFIGSAQYSTIKSLVQGLQWVTHTVAVGDQVGAVEDGLSRVATEARRFVNTRDQTVLPLYQSEVAQLQSAIHTLGVMVADNTDQAARVHQLKVLADGRINSLDQQIAARQAGGTAESGIAELDRIGIAQMDPIRRIIDQVRGEERQLLIERDAKAANDRRRATAVAGLGSLFAVLVVVWGTVALRRDIGERNRAEAALRASEGALRSLSGRLLQAQDEERRRLARELHDGTSQILAAAQLRLATIQMALSPGNSSGQASLAELSTLVERCTREIRTLSHLLHPPLLEHTGIGSAIRWYVEGFSERSGIKVDVQTPEDWPRFDPDTETALFRITQEALTNIHRHSGSNTAVVKAGLKDGQVVLEISDDGRGIPAEVLQTPARLGVGLRGMEERVRLLGGTLSIESGERGTTVRAELPAETRDGYES